MFGVAFRYFGLNVDYLKIWRVNVKLGLENGSKKETGFLKENQKES
jgi:hypothetical protein